MREVLGRFAFRRLDVTKFTSWRAYDVHISVGVIARMEHSAMGDWGKATRVVFVVLAATILVRLVFMSVASMLAEPSWPPRWEFMADPRLSAKQAR